MPLKSIILLFICTSALHMAAQTSTNEFMNRNFWKTNPDIATIETKIAEGHNITEKSQSNYNPTSFAILEKTSINTIKHLLSKKGNDVNELTHDGRTYMFWAASTGNVELMEYLVSKGAKTDVTDDKGSTILNFAAGGGQKNTKVYDFCLANGADLEKDLTPSGANALLLVAPYDTDFSLINYFTSKELDLNSVDASGNGVFSYVAKTGNITLLKQLIEKGVKFDDNAMIFASQGTRNSSNNLEFFKFLEGLGIKPNTVSKDGTTPLHALASRNNDKALLSYFLDKGVNIDQADNTGTTAFMNAAGRNNLEIVTFLSKNVKDINAKNNKGESALSFAITTNTPDVVQFLIDKNANTNITDNNGNDLAFYLIQSYNSRNTDQFETKLKILQSKGFDVTKTQKDGNTLFHLALNHDNLDLLKRVHAFKIDINAKNAEGITALHKAAMKAHDENILKYLISIGADKTISTEFEETVYDLASENELLSQKNIAIDFLK
jgi:ankyrin repeat protein